MGGSLSSSSESGIHNDTSGLQSSRLVILLSGAMRDNVSKYADSILTAFPYSIRDDMVETWMIETREIADYITDD